MRLCACSLGLILVPTPTFFFYKGQLGCKVKAQGDPLVLWNFFTK